MATQRSRPSVQQAKLDWKTDGTPVARAFDDVYFSRESGIEETRYVFLEHTRLRQRFSDAQQDETVTIGETGFGTGLSFLCAWQLRDQVAPDCPLHFISVEKHPLRLDDLKRATGFWPELADFTRQLTTSYPPATPGWHRLSFYQAKVELSLYIGDAAEGFASLDATNTTIDAWFLDGFAPAKNQSMWTDALFHQISRLSSPGTRFSTFTAAVIVREGLEKSGFTITKVKGFGRKRHMLTGIYNNQQQRTKPTQKPWFNISPMQAANQTALVIGAGLAGTSTAFSLARRGWHVKLIDKQNTVAGAASGNPQGVLYSKLSAEPSTHSDFYIAGYLYTLRLLNQLFPPLAHADVWQDCGVLQLAFSEKEQSRQQQFLQSNPQPEELVRPVSQEEASRLSDIYTETGGLFFPGGGWACPPKICNSLAAHPLVDFIGGREVDALTFDNNVWVARDKNKQVIADASIAVIANAQGSRNLSQSAHLPVKSIRGQVSSIPADRADGLKTVVCGDGYVGPALSNRYHLGATFNLDSNTLNCRTEDHQANFSKLTALLPELADQLKLDRLAPKDINGRVGFRATTPDYLPMIGPLANLDAFCDRYSLLRKNANTRFSTSSTAPYYPGLYVTTGHGSKGLTSCPLAGELLAAYICKEPLPLSSSLAEALSPARFIVRDLIRNRL